MGDLVVVVVVVGDRLREFVCALDRATAGNWVLLLLDAATVLAVTTSDAATAGSDVGLVRTSETDDWRTAKDSRASFSIFTRLSL